MNPMYGKLSRAGSKATGPNSGEHMASRRKAGLYFIRIDDDDNEGEEEKYGQDFRVELRSLK
jgi:hypothetical protein